MILFVDFETDHLDGKIIEACCVNNDLKVISRLNDDVSSINEFFKKLCGDDNSDNIIVFWHNFMPVYLSKYQTFIYDNILSGKFIVFTSIYSFFDNDQKTRYSINHITSSLLKREHKGNALDDSIDLAECYCKLKRRLS